MDPDSNKPVYKRVLIKLSGEALMGQGQFGIDPKTVTDICKQVKDVRDLGLEIGLVVGGGNIFRGLAAAEQGIDRVTGDNMGMLATVINALALMDALEKLGVYTRVMSSVRLESFAEPYIRRRAIRHMEKGRVAVFAAGTGNPFFSTDTAASLRAREINAEVFIKATNVDGVYTADPKKEAAAEYIPHLSYMDVLTRGLKVLDSTAISLLMDSQIPIRVVNLNQPGNLVKTVMGENIGTLISQTSS